MTTDLMKNRKGFTLAELLIVVAITAVLVAISIPLISGQLEKAKISTNRANIRAAKASAYSYYIENGFPNGTDTHAYYIYDTESGSLSFYSSGAAGSYRTPETTSKYSRANNEKNGIYKYIIVYIHEYDESSDSNHTIQTDPYYNKSSGKIVYVTGKPYEK